MQKGYYISCVVLKGIFCSYIHIVILEQATHINMSLRTSDYPATTAYIKDHLVLFTIELQWVWLELLKNAFCCECIVSSVFLWRCNCCETAIEMLNMCRSPVTHVLSFLFSGLC
jgi:hypothetical protein